LNGDDFAPLIVLALAAALIALAVAVSAYVGP